MLCLKLSTKRSYQGGHHGYWIVPVMSLLMQQRKCSFVKAICNTTAGTTSSLKILWALTRHQNFVRLLCALFCVILLSNFWHWVIVITSYKGCWRKNKNGFMFSGECQGEEKIYLFASYVCSINMRDLPNIVHRLM